MKMDPRGVLNVISSYNGMVQDVLAVIISFAPNRIIISQREKCSKQYLEYDLDIGSIIELRKKETEIN